LRWRTASSRARIESREQRIRLLEEALRVLKAHTYGASREKLTVAAGQSELFNEIEATVDLADAVGVEPELRATPLRENRSATGKRGRQKLASHLPRVEIRHELPEAERICGCGSVLREIGTDISEQIDYVPAKIQVLRHLRGMRARSVSSASRVPHCPSRSCPRATPPQG
jgi:transposase